MGERTRRRDAAFNREAILDAAVDVLVEDADAPFERIVDASGFARATVYRHFRSREALLAALFDEALDRAREVMGDGVARILDEKTDVLVAIQDMLWIALHQDDRFRRLMAADARFGDALTLQFRDYALALVARGQARGEVAPDLPTDLIARTIRAVSLEVVRTVHDQAATPDEAAIVLRRVFDALRPAG